MECSICYENITKETGKAELSCSHSFHLVCLSKWFIKNESCPCCRHEANETEKMAPMVEEEESDEDEDEDEVEDYAEIIESRERAEHMFRLKRWDMTKAEFEAYAATRISALVRGHQSRQFFFEMKCWKEDERNAKASAEQAEKDFKKAKAAQTFYKKVASMTLPKWKTFAATMIQSSWRAKKQQKTYQKERLSRALAAGLRVNCSMNTDCLWTQTIG
jgi:hypothetical protein